MDPLTVPVVLAGLEKALDAASGEAGKQAWSGFIALMRKFRHRHVAAADAEDPGALAEAAVAAAAADPQLAAELRSWLAQAARLGSRHEGNTANTIGQGARIGNVVQVRDITGPITFH